MKIAMFTNTYLPHVGGVARSVQTLEDACREHGHEVRVVAPEFDGGEESPDVLRVPAVQHFNGSDFSMQLPFPDEIRNFIKAFKPDIIHSHHPFLLGDWALREARRLRVPIVFTYHTLYERYTHYVPLDSPALKRVAIQLAAEYCNLCDQIIAPSESIAGLLRERGVMTPVEVIPTGIDVGFFASGNGHGYRARIGISRDTKVIGHVGRLAKEKNLRYLAEAVAKCLEEDPKLVFLVVGDGDDRQEMLNFLRKRVDGSRIHAVGSQSGNDLADAYAAMDCFAFTSQTETQGLVLAEAMAAGKPVVALDGPGVREIMRDHENGLLLEGHASADEFAAALGGFIHDPEHYQFCAANVRATAERYSTEWAVGSMLDRYQQLIADHEHPHEVDFTPWDRLVSGIGTEWDLFMEKMSAASAAVNETPATKAQLD
jgi:1,2-diacylglycerol 3-alpha-glucosyltransferase